jgi:hypothetical protein
MKTIDRLRKADPDFVSNLKPVDRGFETKCWEWQKSRFGNGYGRVQKNGITRAHRYSYFLAFGSADEEDLILHYCDNKCCCRPEHLYAGDHRDNMDDYKERGVHAHSGEKHKNAVLTEIEIQVIRWLRRTHFSLVQLVDMFDVGKTTIWNILREITWKTVPNKDFSKSEFVEFLARTSFRINAPQSKYDNWRGQEDYDMVASLLEVKTQREVVSLLGISRGSIRNAAKQSKSVYSMKHTKQMIDEYLAWRRKYNAILHLIEQAQ